MKVAVAQISIAGKTADDPHNIFFFPFSFFKLSM